MPGADGHGGLVRAGGAQKAAPSTTAGTAFGYPTSRLVLAASTSSGDVGDGALAGFELVEGGDDDHLACAAAPLWAGAVAARLVVLPAGAEARAGLAAGEHMQAGACERPDYAAVGGDAVPSR